MLFPCWIQFLSNFFSQPWSCCFSQQDVRIPRWGRCRLSFLLKLFILCHLCKWLIATCGYLSLSSGESNIHVTSSCCGNKTGADGSQVTDTIGHIRGSGVFADLLKETYYAYFTANFEHPRVVVAPKTVFLVFPYGCQEQFWYAATSWNTLFWLQLLSCSCWRQSCWLHVCCLLMAR